MTDQRPSVDLSAHDLDAIDPLPAPTEPTPAPAAAPQPGSLLDQLAAEHDELIGEGRHVLQVGRYSWLAARYRALTNDEQTNLARRSQRRQVGRRKDKKPPLEQELADGREDAAFTLAVACVELLRIGDDGHATPLVDALKADGVDTLGDGPLRFDRRTAQVLSFLKLPDDCSSVDVAIELHRHGDGYMPLSKAIGAYTEWMTGSQDESLDELLEGN